MSTPARPQSSEDSKWALHGGEGKASAAARAYASREHLDDDGETTLVDAIAIVFENWRSVTVILALSVFGAAGYLLLASPTFRSDVLVQVEDKQKTLPGLDDLENMLGDKNLADTEIEIIRSRSLIGAVVDRLNLTVVTTPHRFPVFGGALARRYDGDDVAGPLLGMTRYAWGGERLVVTRVDVPDVLLQKKLTLVARDGRRFELFGPDDEMLAQGEVGRAATAPHKKGTVSVFVQELEARPGTRFDVMKRRREDVIDDLQTDLKIAEKGKKTGIITVALAGHDPKQTAAILDSVAQNYLRQNIERRSAEAASRLEFLEQQLPGLKKNLDAAEAVLNAYQLKNGTVDLTLETQALLDRASEIEKSISELELTRSELRQRFTEKHPSLLSLQDKAEKLRAERASMEGRLRSLPQQEITSVRLMRDVKVASELYFMLMNKAEELRVVKSGTIGTVRILDPALLPYEPASPKKLIVIPLALLLGISLGVGFAFARSAMDQALKDPDEIESKTGLPIYASVPHSPREERLARDRKSSGVFRALAIDDPTDLAIESLRSLRTSLQFALVEARNNIITVGGSSPSVGKTFLSVNLAHVLADAGKRVLLVDADLRRGKLHRFFGGQRDAGLSEVVAGQRSLMDVARKTNQPGLEVVSTGKLPPNPSELLGTQGFRAFLAEASGRYDLVLIDVPPILAVTDAALIAVHAGVNLLVLRAGHHPRREIVSALKALSSAGAHVNGAVVNDVQSAVIGRYGRYAYRYHYHYEYRSSRDEEA
jgi:tyrosine-protein kinase Etk/Wzc